MSAESDISERFKRANERRNRAIGAQRIGSLNTLFAYGYGGEREDYVFPEDDAGLEDLKILLHHYALNNPLAMPRITKRRAPWMAAETAERLFEQIDAFPQKWRADTLGRKLNFTGAEWRPLRLRTIAPVDMTKQERVAFSQSLARQRRQAKRQWPAIGFSDHRLVERLALPIRREQCGRVGLRKSRWWRSSGRRIANRY